MSNVQAATWYGIKSARTDQSVIFFDMETVTKQPGSVKLWIKYVYSEKLPDPDGSYSSAHKTVYSCTKRTVQGLIEVRYDKTHNHMKTYDVPEKASDIIPGSVGEDIWKVVCASDFPNVKSDKYIRIIDNDIYGITKRIFDSENDPAPK